MTVKMGHTAVAVLQGRREFAKGGLAGTDISFRDYAIQASAKLSSGRGTKTAAVIGETLAQPGKRTAQTMKNVREEGLLARRREEKRPLTDAPMSPQKYYMTLAAKVRQKLRQQAAATPDDIADLKQAKLDVDRAIERALATSEIV